MNNYRSALVRIIGPEKVSRADGLRFLKIVLYIEFTLNLFTIIIGLFDISASREIFPTGDRSHEIRSEDKQYLPI
jgi:hypothetical protein